MSGCDIEAAFAAHAVRTRFADLPPVAVAKAKTFLLDTLGVGIAGRTGAHAEAIARLAAAWGKGQEATCWLDGARLAAGSAAVVNAYLIHCLEFDCVHEGAGGASDGHTGFRSFLPGRNARAHADARWKGRGSSPPLPSGWMWPR